MSTMTRDYTRDYLEGRANLGADYDKAIASRPDEAFMDRREAELLREVLPRLFGGRVPRALDFACGTGRLTQVLEGQVDELWGLDVTPAQLEVAKQRCRRTQFVLADGSTGALPVPQVDLVTAFRFFANANEELRRSALISIEKVLRPGGYLIFNNHRNSASPRNVLLRAMGRNHEGRLSYWHMKRLLGERGLRIVGAYGIGVWMVRARWMSQEALDSGWARRAERLSKVSLLAPFSPDTLVIAQKR